jgi:hypothetical protein
MKQEEGPRYWVAIRVWRGFPVEAKAFRKKIHANKQERIWRRTINPDYDETEVLPLSLEKDSYE